eukprot:5219648-Prymnesium_polylepis.2
MPRPSERPDALERRPRRDGVLPGTGTVALPPPAGRAPLSPVALTQAPAASSMYFAHGLGALCTAVGGDALTCSHVDNTRRFGAEAGRSTLSATCEAVCAARAWSVEAQRPRGTRALDEKLATLSYRFATLWGSVAFGC